MMKVNFNTLRRAVDSPLLWLRSFLFWSHSHDHLRGLHDSVDPCHIGYTHVHSCARFQSFSYKGLLPSILYITFSKPFGYWSPFCWWCSNLCPMSIGSFCSNPSRDVGLESNWISISYELHVCMPLQIYFHELLQSPVNLVSHTHTVLQKRDYKISFLTFLSIIVFVISPCMDTG